MRFNLGNPVFDLKRFAKLGSLAIQGSFARRGLRGLKDEFPLRKLCKDAEQFLRLPMIDWGLKKPLGDEVFWWDESDVGVHVSDNFLFIYAQKDRTGDLRSITPRLPVASGHLRKRQNRAGLADSEVHGRERSPY